MSQNNVDFSGNPSGAGLMDDYLDKEQQNVLTSNSGIQRPSYAVAGTKWLDTSVTPWLWKMYDGTSDVTLGTVNPSTHLFTPAGVLPSQEDQSGKFLQTNGSNTLWTDAVDYTNITNCITAIPQDIKLELNNGTLTLKAGSKVYVPNGVGVFNTINITSDSSISDKNFSSGVLVIFSNIFGTSIRAVYTSFCTSGTSAPSDNKYRAWYDTTNNLVKNYNEGSYLDNMSLPIAVCTYVKNEGFTSIDQVFNGFGYIGSTIFALPGVEGLIPNGRNTDGTLKSIENTTTSVLTYSWNPGIQGNNFPVVLYLWGVHYLENENTFIGGERPSNPTPYTRWYNEKENQWYDYITDWNKKNLTIFGYVDLSDGKITSFNPKTVFHAVDYYDFKQLDDSAAKLDEINTFTGNNTFTQPIECNHIEYKNSQGDFSDVFLTNQINTAMWAQLRCKRASSSISNYWIGIGADINGEALTYAPTPAISDNSTQIATTAWVNSRITSIMNSGAVGFPNHAAKQTLTLNTTGTAPANGWLLYTIDLGDVGEFVLYIQGQIVSKAGINYGSTSVGCIFPIKSGQTYRTTNTRNSTVNFYFIPQA